MALTGALGGRKAARRVNETSSFFAVTTLPGALERFGRGFEAAAMVRLMHSMVRYNALKRSNQWDVEVYGIPVPQVDQMPAGLLGIYLLAAKARRQGRTEFTDSERAAVEFARYRCFLLGLPEELLPTTVQETLHVMHARAALLRDGFDDETCGSLVRATMDAYLRAGNTPLDRIAEAVEKSYSKAFFIRAFSGGDRKVAGRMGVSVGPGDVVRIAATAPLVIGHFLAVQAAGGVPVVRNLVDVYAILAIKGHLATYGKPEFTTDAAQYRPVHQTVAAAA
jgi:mpaB/rubber oxygenase-like protein